MAIGFRRLFLKLGDQVTNRRYPEWGLGEVVEERTAVTVGGTCFVRVMFADGCERSFINNLDDVNCCYYAGVRLAEPEVPRSRRSRASRTL